MTDDLKERLRANHLDECYDAIDRIEELESKLATCEKYRDAYAECDRIGTQAVRNLEAKLAKAVAFIEFLDENYRHVWGETARLKIRTLHAELTGGKDDTDR